MKTVVYQSYRTMDVAPWIQRCLETVKDWTAQQGFAYHFVDDSLFDYVPIWYRDKVDHNILLISDLARLEVAKELLAQGYERTIWVDADIVVFDPRNFKIDTMDEFAFCQELWAAPDTTGKITYRKRVHNAICVFMQGNTFLEFYSNACLRMVQSKQRINPLDVGTNFLSSLFEMMPFPLINNVGMFSPSILYSIDHNQSEILHRYRSLIGSPLQAANLCGSMINKPWFGK